MLVPAIKVYQAVVRTGRLGKTHSPPARVNQPRHITDQPRTPPVPATNSVASLLLPRPVSSVQVPRREDEEIASIQTLHTHRQGDSPSPPKNTNNKAKPTSPTSQDLNPTTSSCPPPASCLRLPVSRLPVSYPPSISVIPLPSAPTSQPRASPSLDRSWASIASSALCRRQHPCCRTHLRRRRSPAGPPSLPPTPKRHRLPAGTRNRRSGSVSLFFFSGEGSGLVNWRHSAL